jgi:tRNA nucleotidyltransferase/poly(A) polymerase
MADYIYLLESRLSKTQQNALLKMREIAREKGLTVFLVGGAVRDLTSGSPVRDLDVAVQGNALKLKKDIEKAGGTIVGENEPGQALFVQFPRGVKLEVGSTLSVTYPKPGKPVHKPATILDDLRRRDFTANAMALSLNEGSFGLLMDPLNGVADIENRELRLVSNYGFIEDPIRMVRAARLMARLGWAMDEKTAVRYETGKQEGYISAASKFQIGYEAEEIVHEEDPLRVLTRLEAEGWMKVLAPAWTSAKVNVAELEHLREGLAQLQMQGIHPNTAAAQFPLLTAKLSAKDVADLKASFPRPGFVREIEALEGEAKELAAQLTSKSTALPSQTWKLLHSAKPEAVLMVAYSSKSAAIQAKFKSFFTEWPQLRQKVPYTLMQEMRIVPDLPGYEEFVDSIFFELMDGKLATAEEMKAFLEPFSPPAPPPTVHLRRPRAAKKDSKGKGRAKKAAEAASEEGGENLLEVAAELLDTAATGSGEESPSEPVDLDGDDDDAPAQPPVKSAPAKTPPAKVEAAKVAPAAAPVAKKAPAPVKKVPVPAKAAAKPAAKAPAKTGLVKSSPAKSAAVAKKAVPAKKSVPAKKPAAKPVARTAVAKAPAKKIAAKAVAKRAPAKAPMKSAAKSAPSKPAAKKVPAKPAGKSRK